MIGSAIALGLFAGLIEQRRRSGVYRYYPESADGADVMPEDGGSQEPSGVYPFYGREAPRPQGNRRVRDNQREQHPSQTAMPEFLQPLQSLWDELRAEVIQERDRLQSAVLQTGRAFIHDFVRIAGQSLLDQLTRSGSGDSRQGQRRIRCE